MEDGTPGPNVKTYGILLHSLSHSGKGEEAQRIWEQMEDDGMKMDAHVVTSLIDGMARKGLLSEAYGIVMKYDIGHWPTWLALLSGCRTHENEVIAVEVYGEIKKRFGNDEHVMNSASTLISQIIDVD